MRRPPYRVSEALAVPYPGPPAKPIRGPEDVLAACRAMARYRQEHFVVLLLNARHELERRVLVSKGSLNASIVHPRLCAATHKRGYVAAALSRASGASHVRDPRGGARGQPLALGHPSIVVTQRYARLTDEHVRAEAERISGNSVADSVAETSR